MSEGFGDGRRQVLTRDLNGLDGIVVVGGDGTFSNIAQGLLERSQRDAGLDLRKRKEDEKEDAASSEVTSVQHLGGFCKKKLITCYFSSLTSNVVRFTVN